MYVLSVTVVFTALAAVTVALRLYTRFFLVKAPGLDDAMIVPALACTCVFTALVIVGKSSIHPAMLHQQRNCNLTHPQNGIMASASQDQIYHRIRSRDNYLYEPPPYIWLSIPFYNLSLIFSKLSALALYRRIFKARHLLPVVYGVMGFLIVAALWMTLSGFIFCLPIHQFWNPDELSRRSHCLPEGPVWFVNAGIQVATDIIILGLPMPLLWRLHLPRRQKWGVMVCFGIGIFIVGTSVTRMYELSRMVRHGDFTRTNASAAVWSSLEANVSIICICLPPLNPLFARILSYCFLPQPIHSSPASKQNYATNTSNRTNPDMIWYNNLFYPEQTRYSASISKVNTNEDGHDRGNAHGTDNDHGIRVVRELNIACTPSAFSPGHVQENGQDGYFAPRPENSSIGNGGVVNSPRSQPSIEWDLGDFEFPNYKETMNAPIGRR
ncbi:hypothetical protein N7535_007586 [Penicillium sp. DV-2018c]|nr:hypothetical protein N7461_003613 [Penicillium sp. DV-2018c]KAJ5565948.1 hypothetical protein N7535_007586 [Penicillium sp. DV-2018c]